MSLSNKLKIGLFLSNNVMATFLKQPKIKYSVLSKQKRLRNTFSFEAAVSSSASSFSIIIYKIFAAIFLSDKIHYVYNKRAEKKRINFLADWREVSLFGERNSILIYAFKYFLHIQKDCKLFYL